ncbi:Cell division protein FtsK (plasmid) [Sinorhizobium sojae CCBAU 05684]|uniref:Cell division protein FtsK n=1 Tax=Sinorhizobium sojae CCBAU 05684 TaxID=716928 RepID=A0A249PJS9_9HYPH|nr:hypothetical protein [Sinorhizobium sojae]ASY66056.1 Cell division protein FtsK [Sinorhizobium sojae CCBAU 05684]
MLVYGDPKRAECADVLCEAIAERLAEVAHQPPGLARHMRLVGVLLNAGELAQGLSDLEFKSLGADEVSPVREAAGGLLLQVGRLVVQSWLHDFTWHPSDPGRMSALLRELRMPEALSIKEAEGFAFYGLYPESYIEAAIRSRLSPNRVVIGIRSIGTSLSAVVSAAIGAKAPETVRPVGPPYRKRIAIAPTLSRQLLRDPDADFAIVDEGPGLSGSSFGSVADWLEEHATCKGRIHFFPGHKGSPGPEATRRHQSRWKATPRHVVDMDELLLGCVRSSHRLASWVSNLVGPLKRPLEDISCGAWRRATTGDQHAWPPTDRRFERRKFLAHTAEGAWLVKFAGLGDIGERKYAKARLLAEAGFTAPVAGLCHGFLVQKWVPAHTASRDLHRPEFIAHLGEYLAFRARRLPPPKNGGASLAKLSEMTLMNTEEALGRAFARAVRERVDDVARYADLLVRIDTDNRLHPWEWLKAGERGYLKADALDHSEGHDLVGAQDVVWDIAGAAIEFDLSPGEAANLRAAVSDGCLHAVNAELQSVFEIFYLAFQIGLWTSARKSASADEASRLEAVASRYVNCLRQRTLEVAD